MSPLLHYLGEAFEMEKVSASAMLARFATAPTVEACRTLLCSQRQPPLLSVACPHWVWIVQAGAQASC